MDRLKGLLARLRGVARRREAERELEAELRFHLEMEADKYVREGATEAEARRRAAVEFGGVEATKEALRDGRGVRWVDDLARDLRYALRTLRRSPGFAAAAILTLALGIGANSAIFSVVSGVVLRPLPYPEPAELTTVWLNNPRQGIERDVTSYPNFVGWRESRSFEAMAAVRGVQMNLTGDGEPRELLGASVTQGFFELLGVRPARGRTLTREEWTPGGPLAVVLSHELWATAFGGDPGVVGRRIRLDGAPYTVAGVLPAGLGYPAWARFWVALENQPVFSNLRDARGSLWLPVIGRLADGITLDAAQAEMTAIARRLEQQYPVANEGMGVLLEPLHETIVGDVRPALLILLGAVGLVLLIACGNVGNLLLTRGMARRREVAVRAALGASRSRLARQILTEGALLAGIGGALGLVLTWLGVDLLAAAAPADVPRIEGVAVDGRVAAFTLAASAFAALVFGLAPAWEVSRRSPSPSLKDGVRGTTRGVGRARPVLVAGQVTLSLVLLIGAGLLVRSFARLQAVDTGFRPEGVLNVPINLSPGRYPDADAIRAFYDRLLPAVEALPGVRSADVVSTWFLRELPRSASVSIEGRPDVSDAERNIPVAYDGATPGLFRTLGVRLLRGRDLAETDRADSPPVAVVNEAFVRRFLSDGDAVGARFTFGSTPEDDDWITIVGVVADSRRSGLEREARPAAFLPFRAFSTRATQLMVRTAGDPLALAGAVREAIRRIDADQPVPILRTLDQQITDSLTQRRFTMFLLAAFAVASLALAAIGIYGVMAHAVMQRRHEIGIRMALGARAPDVVRLIVGQSMRVTLAGLTAGIAAALAAGRVLEGMLFGVRPTDPATFSAAAVLLAAVALAASYAPTRRATRVEPVVALRTD